MLRDPKPGKQGPGTAGRKKSLTPARFCTDAYGNSASGSPWQRGPPAQSRAVRGSVWGDTPTETNPKALRCAISIRYKDLWQNEPNRPIFHAINRIQLRSGTFSTKINARRRTIYQGFGDQGTGNARTGMNHGLVGRLKSGGCQPRRGSQAVHVGHAELRAGHADLDHGVVGQILSSIIRRNTKGR